MGKALYRKYRPRKFSETIGQEAITETLAKTLRSGRISHAYLFSGPRGVGKTSVARILAHEVNSLPYEDDKYHLDIIEIDAASNRRIDEIRDLREKVRIAPTSARYKVYIIDEVHMLTKEAFNALLKTLEEPPAHCIFILATTEPHKLPETIVSRTQKFNFRPISAKDVIRQLSKIAKSESINIDNEALGILAEHSDGSLRDIVGLLDQLSVSKKISAGDVEELLGVPSKKLTEELLESILDQQPKESLHCLQRLREKGADPLKISQSLSRLLRREIIDKGLTDKLLVDLLRNLLEVGAHNRPQEALELAVLEAATTAKNTTVKTPKPPVQNSASKAKPARQNNSFDQHWEELISRVRQEEPSLFAALRLAKAEYIDGELKLSFPYSLHQKKVKQARYLENLRKMLFEISGQRVVISCVVEKHGLEDIKHPATGSMDLRTISNIFGSAEVLES